jgi:simple sugar transport system substrate-binding protein
MIGLWRGVTLAAALPLMTAAVAVPAQAQEALGEGMTIYMQMGGNPGDGATLPRTNGARAAAAAFGVADLVEQYSGWLPEQMLNHFREAQAADPDCIVIMGHRARAPSPTWSPRPRSAASW